MLTVDSPFRGEFDGIAQEIHEDLPEPILIRQQERQIRLELFPRQTCPS